MKNILIIIAILLFCFTTLGLTLIYPNVETDYYEFLDYYYTEQRLNEVLVCLLFFVIIIVSENRLLRALSTLGFTLTFSSMVDKVFFSNYDYLYSDAIIVLVSLYLSYKTYKNGKNPS
jgi:hypothetical protein